MGWESLYILGSKLSVQSGTPYRDFWLVVPMGKRGDLAPVVLVLVPTDEEEEVEEEEDDDDDDGGMQVRYFNDVSLIYFSLTFPFSVQS